MMFKISLAAIAVCIALGSPVPSFACPNDPRCPDCNGNGPKYTPSVRPSKEKKSKATRGGYQQRDHVVRKGKNKHK
jgi:hypothetical protein